MSLDDLLIKAADHYNRMEAIGPAKCNPSVDKQPDGKDNKKNGYKSAVADPAISDSATSSEKCQLCQSPHSAIHCPMFQAFQQRDAEKRGKLFPGKSDKDGKRSGVKAGQGFEASEDKDDKFLLCMSKV